MGGIGLFGTAGGLAVLAVIATVALLLPGAAARAIRTVIQAREDTSAEEAGDAVASVIFSMFGFRAWRRFRGRRSDAQLTELGPSDQRFGSPPD